jgi:signal transduction histidine kinase
MVWFDHHGIILEKFGVPIMRNFDFAALSSIIGAGIYLWFAFSARRQGIVNRMTQSIMTYALLSAIWEVLWAIYRWGLFDVFRADFGRWLVIFGILILALVFLICTMFFLQVKSGFWAWVGIYAGFGMIALAVLVSLFPLSGNVRVIIFALLFIGWMVIVGLSCSITYTAFQQAKKPRNKNRVGYWGLSLALTILGDLILFSGVIRVFGAGSFAEYPATFWIFGSTLHMVGALMAGYVALIHDAIDLVWGFLRLLSYVSVTIIGIFFSVLIMGIDLSRVTFLQNETIELIVKALVLIVIVVPVLSWLYGYANQLLFGKGVDRDTAVREYGLSISNLVDLNKLAEVALEFLNRTFGVDFSLLLIVDDVPEEEFFRLVPVQNPVREYPDEWQLGHIHKNSIYSRHFLRERSILSQYDLEFLPKFKTNSIEKGWLTSFQAELFVPILTKESWIGLIVLGSKRSGDQYFGDDIDLLNTLSNQTVAALQNARLFSDLSRLNEDLRDTYQALEEANRKMRDLDEMKSAFISVVTHEMRTPLANMGFSLQVFEMSGTQNLLPEQIKQLRQISMGIKTSRSMIDNLITLAAFLNNQVDLYLEKLDFQQILDNITPPFITRASEKGVNLKIDKVGDIFLIGDRKHLSIAVSHLIDNALKFTERNGSIWVSCWTTADALWLDVRDTGQGIAQEKLERVWQSFTQLQADAVRRGVEGLGLGLSLVKFIIQAHGGQVFVESEVDSGSVFGFRIPLKGPNYPLKAAATGSLERKF